MINSFTINGQTFEIIMTGHAQERQEQRHIDLFLITGNIMLLGGKLINKYNNSNEEIFLMDKKHNFSMVFTIRDNKIYIETLIAKSNCYVKDGTQIINL